MSVVVNVFKMQSYSFILTFGNFCVTLQKENDFENDEKNINFAKSIPKVNGYHRKR